MRVPMTQELPLVVVVEDDLATSAAVGRVLRAGGFDTLIYSSAEAFLESPPPRVPKCLLLDLQLGGMSGFELHRELRSRGSRVPVIVMTAVDDVHLREKASRIGCAGYLDKLSDVAGLFAILASL
jgi:FixJ family two-component response regulator